LRKIYAIFAVSALFWASPLLIKAAETGAETASHVAITIVMPDTAYKNAAASTVTPTPAFTPTPIPPMLFPSSVEETYDGAQKQIVKTYELIGNDDPQDIPRDSFERGGWRYTLADILKRETISSDTQEHVETVTMDSKTDDVNSIIGMLEPTMDYKSDSGYSGVLNLDVTTVKVQEAGTKTSSYTATATREYPHLSANDTSLVPKTINDNGNTMSLSDVSWRSDNTDTEDYYQLTDSYTAVATYTRSANKTTVTGYDVTADYKGSISKLSAGKTIYAAIFIGEEIAEPILQQVPDSTVPDKPEQIEPDAEQAEQPPQSITTEIPSETAAPVIPAETFQTTDTDSGAALSVSALPEVTPTPSQNISDSHGKPLLCGLPFLIAAILCSLLAGGFMGFFVNRKLKAKEVVEKSPEYDDLTDTEDEYEAETGQNEDESETITEKEDDKD